MVALEHGNIYDGPPGCLVDRTVTVPYSTAGTVQTDTTGAFYAGGNYGGPGSTQTASIAKIVIKKRNGHRHICKAATGYYTQPI